MLCDDALSRESKTMRCTCVPTRKDLLDGKGCGDDMQCINRLLFMECGARCPSGKYCTNKRFQKVIRDVFISNAIKPIKNFTQKILLQGNSFSLKIDAIFDF